VGVMVGAVSVASEMEREEVMAARIKEKMWSLLNVDDAEDLDHNMSKYEVTQLLQYRETRRFLYQVGIDVRGLVDFLEVTLKDGRDYKFVDIIFTLLDFRGTNVCTVKTIVELRKWLSTELDQVHCMLGAVDRRAFEAVNDYNGVDYDINDNYDDYGLTAIPSSDQMDYDYD